MPELSESLRGYIDGAAAPITIDEVQQSTTRRGGTRPVNRRRLVVLFASAVVLAVVGGLLWMNRTTGQQVHTVAPKPSHGSSHQAVAIQGDSMVLFDTNDGHVLKHLAAAPSLDRSSQTLSVSPDGSTVWFASAEASSAARCPAPAPNSVATVDSINLRTREVRVLGPGQQPAVSPNGRFLAYVRPPLGVCSSENLNVLVVRDLQTGHDQTWSVSGTAAVSKPRWLSDSRHLVVTRDGSYSWRMDTSDPNGLAHAVKQEQQYGTILLGIRGHTDQLLSAKYDQGDNRPGGMAIGTFSPVTGKQTQFLFELPGSPAPNEIQGTSDRTGNHILAIIDQRLYRWSVGDNAPTTIADDVDTTAWIPPTSSPGVPSTTTARSATATNQAFAGHRWVPVEVLAGNKTLPVVSPDSGTLSNPYIEFARKGGKFGANDGCNEYGGTAIISPTTVTLNHGFRTEVACLARPKPGTREPIETLQQVMVSNVPQQWKIIAGRLHLRTSNGETVVFRSQTSP